MPKYIDLNRSFWPVEADKENDPESIRISLALGVDRGASWDDLLEKARVVIIAEPGTGKTEEFHAIADRLRAAGKSAFFCKIELLEGLDIWQTFDVGTSEDFHKWLAGDQKGYFFLDSVDEARLKDSSAFEKALRRFAGAIGESLQRAKVFVSCRVSEWRATADLSMFLRLLPEPDIIVEQKSGEITPDLTEQSALKALTDAGSIKSEEKQDHVVFQLAPLNEIQIRHFAAEKGIENIGSFIQAIERADAMIFAERPQDLLDLITYWKEKGCLGRHSEMLDFNIKSKLLERNPDRDDQKPLSSDDALFGAERIAAAVTLQKKDVIVLPDRPVNADLQIVSIEAKDSLPSWPSDKIQTLLDRAIFDEAIYGTVRFHHRSVREYLAAQWLQRLLNEGKSRRSIEGMIFSSRYGCDVVIPSMRPISAWLALWDDRVRSRILAIAPEVLIMYGDPSSLSVEFRRRLLTGFAELYSERKHTGTSFDIAMIRHLADPSLASTINELFKKYAVHTDVCTLLLKLIWQGQIADSVSMALPYAMNDQGSSYTRICAVRAIAAAGAYDQKSKLASSLLRDTTSLDQSILSELIEAFFPSHVSVNQLLEIIKATAQPDLYSSSPLYQSIETVVDCLQPDEVAVKFLRGLHELLITSPFIEQRYCKISERYVWLLPIAIRVANLFVKRKDPFSFDPVVLNLFVSYLLAHHYAYISSSEKENILKAARAWPEFQLFVFWYSVAAERERDEQISLTYWGQVWWNMHDLWEPSPNDIERLIDNMINKPLMDDRLIALTAIFTVYVNQGRPRLLLERLKRLITGEIELVDRLAALLHPNPLSEAEKIRRRQRLDAQRKKKAEEKRKESNLLKWQQALRRNPDDVRNVGDASKGEVWRKTSSLYRRLEAKEEERRSHSFGYSNWQSLIDEFGFDVAKNFHDGCIAYWRGYDPFVYPNRRTDTSIPWARIIGLTGLAMEAADNPEWTKNISRDEAMVAAHYAVCEMSGLPPWFKSLLDIFPDIVDAVIIDELRYELHESSPEQTYFRVLSALLRVDKPLIERYRRPLFDLLAEREPVNERVLSQSLSLILSGEIDAFTRENILNLARKSLDRTGDTNHKCTWLVVIFCLDGLLGCKLLKEWINGLSFEKEQKESMVSFCASLTDHGDPRFNRTFCDYERVEVLKELLPFIYQFVQVGEDIRHEGAFTPSLRDYAKRTWSYLLSILDNTPGRQSYEALLHLSASVEHGYSKDHFIYLAKERAALDAEFAPWEGRDVAEFADAAERQPRSEADLFELALVRLDDLRADIEDGDESEAVLLQKLTQETEVRTVLANRLRSASRSRYTVGSEEELADSTRTDIRLNAPQVAAPVPIEIKIADNKWTIEHLRERLENQLICQYMRSSHYGIFLIVHNGKQNRWREAQSKRMLSFTELITLLENDAVTLTSKYPSVSALAVVGIDFAARLTRRMPRH